MVLVILGILALILLMGNAYLHFFPLNGRNSHENGYSFEQLDEWERSLNSLHVRNHKFEKEIVHQEKAVARKLRALDTSTINLNSKTEDALKRIGRIESILSAKTLPAESQLSAARKIERLEDFRRNAIIEIQAIKDQMPHKKKKKFEDASPDLEEKIHNLVYHGKGRKR